MDSHPVTDNKRDSISRLREYVREYKLQRGEEFIDVNETKDKDKNASSTKTKAGNATSTTPKDDDSASRPRVYVRDYRLQKEEIFVECAKPISTSKVPLSSESKSKAKTSKRVTGLTKDYFMDDKSISSSSSESTNDYENDFVSFSDGRRPSFFIESSKVSLSSDDEEDSLPLSNLMFILTGQGMEGDAIYNDWDSGLSHSSIELNQDDSDDDAWTNGSNLVSPDGLETSLDFPHRALRYMECQICLEMEYLRRRVCCDFQICNKCLVTYLIGKVTDGKVQIECANDRCNALMYKDEIRHRLPMVMREKFTRFLIGANQDPYKKTCPSCSLPYEIDRAKLKVSKKKLKYGVEVMCTKCRLVWCFRCQAPFHTNMTCKKYRNEDEMVKRWAKGKTLDGQANAQKCPKCKIFVQKMDGCDHMKCTQCETNFCYKCGDRYISVKFFGSHWNRFSLFGCKYRLMPEKNGLRRLIRGSHFVGRVLAAIVLTGVGVAAGAVLVAGSVVILPGYGILRLKRRMWAAKQRKKFNRVKMRWISVAEKQRALEEKQNGNNLETVVEESETETLEQTSDPQQIQVIVHQHEEDALFADDANKDSDIIPNKYASEDSEVARSQHVSKEGAASLAKDDVLVLNVSDLKDVALDGKHKKIIVNLVSSSKKGCEENVEDTVDSGVVCDDSHDGERKSEGGEEKDEKNDVEEGKLCEIDVNSLDYYLDNEVVHVDVDVSTVDNPQCLSDVQKSRSLSRGSSNLSEKIFTKTKVSKVDNNDNKNTAPLKVDAENGGKGCFGNIFNVSKRTSLLSTSVTSNSNEEEGIIRSNRDKSQSVDIKKAATWEKCRRTKVNLDSAWMNKDSLVDSDSNLANCGVLKCSSSFSSITRPTLAGLDDESDCSVEHYSDCLSSAENAGSDRNPVGAADKADNSVSVGRIQVDIAGDDSNHKLPFDLNNADHISEISSMTHL